MESGVSPGLSVARYLSVSPIKDADFRKLTAEMLRVSGIPE